MLQWPLPQPRLRQERRALLLEGQRLLLLRPLLQRCEFLQFRPLACEVGLALAEAARWLGLEDAANLERDSRQQAASLGMQGLLQEWPAAGSPTGRPGVAGETDNSNLLSQRERSVLQLLAEGFSN